MTAPISDYPKAESASRVTYWTGPVSAPGTYVTGWKKRSGARVTYYSVTCTCREHIFGKPVEREVYGLSYEDTFTELERIAYDHAAAHVLEVRQSESLAEYVSRKGFLRRDA